MDGNERARAAIDGLRQLASWVAACSVLVGLLGACALLFTVRSLQLLGHVGFAHAHHTAVTFDAWVIGAVVLTGALFVTWMSRAHDRGRAARRTGDVRRRVGHPRLGAAIQSRRAVLARG